MRDYRFFFLAEVFEGLKTTDFVSRGTVIYSASGVSRGTKKKSRANPALLFHVKQSPSDLCERIVCSLEDERGHDHQEELAYETAAVLERQHGTDQGPSDLADSHHQPKLPQEMAAVSEPQQRRAVVRSHKQPAVAARS